MRARNSSNKTRLCRRVLAAAVVAALVLAGNGFAQGVDTVRVAYRAAAEAGVSISVELKPSGDCPTRTATVQSRDSGRDTILALSKGGASSVLHGAQRQNAPALFSYNRGNVSLRLAPQQFGSAEISLHAVNGKRVLHSKADALSGTHSIARANLAAGAYMLSVKGVSGNSYATKLAHSGGRLNINVAFGGENLSLGKSASINDCGTWTLTFKADGFDNGTLTVNMASASNGRIDAGSVTLRATVPQCTPGVDCPEGGPNTPCKAGEACEIFRAPTARATFTETVGSQSFEMVYVPSGTFTIGSSGCTGGSRSVTLSPYFISKTTVSQSLWNAVMTGTGKSMSDMDWYDAFTFACKLSQLTGKNYRMQTEAEYEYAAKGCASGVSITRGSSGMGAEEWAYNSWESNPATGTDPIGGWSGWCTQKTRRNAPGVTDRLIRSIEGVGPVLRLTISADKDYPPGYIPSCNLKHPQSQNATTPNTFRDPRWVTGGNMRWENGAIGIGSSSALHVWDDGTARLGSTNGQWFTSNNMSFVFVPSSGTRTQYKYIFQDPRQVAIISDQDYTNGGFVGRKVKQPVATAVTKPTVSGLMEGEALAKAQSDYADYFVRYDFANLPSSAKKQDSRLIEGSTVGWFQNNATAGGIHNYRKDVAANSFRFAVIQGSMVTMLAAGEWFTVNNTFLRVTSSSGYEAEYLYALTSGSSPTFYHNSYLGYEPGDFRMFVKTNNNAGTCSGNTTSGCFPSTCSGTYCSSELTGNSVASMYASGTRGKSTFVPPPCPSGGC